MNDVVLNLTIHEAQFLQQLINIAVKSGGLEVAPGAIILNQKLMKAVEASDGGRNLGMSESSKLKAVQ